MKKRTLTLVISLLLVALVAVGGTLAWLKAETTPVVNTFSPSDIGVELKEHKYDATNDVLTNEETTEGVNNYKMIPGWTIPKDPKATVTSGSEDCYLFVKVEKSTNFNDYMEMAIDTQWTAVPDVTGVYYIKIDEDSEKNVPYNILGEGTAEYNDVEYTWTDNQVLVKPTVTKTMMENVNPNPTLTFTAYATQLYKDNKNDFTVTEAWAIAQTLN